MIASRRDLLTAPLEVLAFSNILTLNALVDLPEERGVHRQDTIGSKSFAYLDGESNRPQSFVSFSQNGRRGVDVGELREFARLYGKPLDFFVS